MCVSVCGTCAVLAYDHTQVDGGPIWIGGLAVGASPVGAVGPDLLGHLVVRQCLSDGLLQGLHPLSLLSLTLRREAEDHSSKVRGQIRLACRAWFPMSIPEGFVGGDEVKHLVFGVSNGGATSLDQSDANAVLEALDTNAEVPFACGRLQVGAAWHKTMACLLANHRLHTDRFGRKLKISLKDFFCGFRLLFFFKLIDEICRKRTTNNLWHLPFKSHDIQGCVTNSL